MKYVQSQILDKQSEFLKEVINVRFDLYKYKNKISNLKCICKMYVGCDSFYSIKRLYVIDICVLSLYESETKRNELKIILLNF